MSAPFDLQHALESFRPPLEYLCGETYESLNVISGEKPTLQALQNHWSTLQATLDSAEIIRKSLLTEFEKEPIGVQIHFKPTADALRDYFKLGQVATAKAIIQTTPVLSSLEGLRTRLLAHFE